MGSRSHGYSWYEFQNTQELWQSYVERLQQYFVANNVKNVEKQWAILLSAVGGPTYQLIRNLLAPTKPTEVAFADIVQAVQSHHHPRPSVIVQRLHMLRNYVNCWNTAISSALSTCYVIVWYVASPTNGSSADFSLKGTSHLRRP